ncbi:MAG: GGDEF domain-containing protein [Pseudomonadota bacterium]
MAQEDESALLQVGLYLSPVGQRRVDFQAACGEQFARLFLADGTEQAAALLARQDVDLLVIDLERFEYSFDLAVLGDLVASRAGARTLLICPFGNAGWLPELMARGPLEYVISPLQDEQLRRRIRAAPAATPEPAEEAAYLRALLAAGARLQQAIAEVDDLEKMAGQVCSALSTLPGVVHASLFHMRDAGELELEAQHSRTGFNLTRLLLRSDRLMQSPLRHAFPGLLAACSNEIVLLDAPAKAGEPEMAVSLAEIDVEMVLGLPLPVSRAGAPRGALCLMFERARQFPPDQMASLVALAQLAGFGLRMAEMSRENEQLLGRLTHMATTDALTGMANRRHGETLLELEVRRARRYRVPLALIAFDIDRFKAINDQFGHAVGDAAIRTVADLVQAALRNSDVLVRSGGCEFQIIAPHTSAIDALKMAEKIRVVIAEADVAGCDHLTISLGVGQLADEESPDAMTIRVDAALARAKRAGRNCVELAMQ